MSQPGERQVQLRHMELYALCVGFSIYVNLPACFQCQLLVLLYTKSTDAGRNLSPSKYSRFIAPRNLKAKVETPRSGL